MSTPTPVAFVLNRLNMKSPLPVELIPGCTLRRASDPEIERFAQLSRFTSGEIDRLFRFRMRYVSVGAQPGAFNHETLPRDSWMFFVVEADQCVFESGSDWGFQEVEACSRLTGLELSLGAVLYPSGMYSLNPRVFYQHSLEFRDMEHPDGELFDAEHARRISALYGPLLALRRSHPDVHRSFDLFRGTLAVDRDHPLHVLGLFAVMESLITHSPHDKYDSICHQVRTKMPLLDRRFDEPIDYSAFAGAGTKKIWDQLYACRSRIAHGGPLDFSSGDLKLLRGLGEVSRFMRGICKRLLRHTLRETDLIVDLQHC